MWSWLIGMDPITKGVWLFGTGLAVMWSMKLEWQGGWLLSILFIGITGSGWTAARWRTVLLLLLSFASPLLLFQWLMLPGTGLWISVFGLSFTQEAFLTSLTLTMRAVTLFLSSLLYASTTTPRDIVTALAHHLRLPAHFAYAVAIALCCVPLFVDEVQCVRAAQRLRQLVAPQGVGSHMHLIWQAVKLILTGALWRVQIVATAMEAKQFGTSAKRTSWRTLRFTGVGFIFAAVTVAALVATLFWG